MVPLPFFGEVMDRFWSKVDRSGECWIWTAYRDSFGYGNFKVDGVNCYAHRICYELEHGSIPEGMCVLHRCDNPSCVNPEHLFLGTHRDNVKDKISKRRHCIGSKNGRSKMTRERVRVLRAYKKGLPITDVMLGQRFGISATSARDIVSGKHWKHV